MCARAADGERLLGGRRGWEQRVVHLGDEIVADAMELRPNDILYVAEQPIISFNRALATILPLRVLLRDIQNENIP